MEGSQHRGILLSLGSAAEGRGRSCSNRLSFFSEG